MNRLPNSCSEIVINFFKYTLYKIFSSASTGREGRESGSDSKVVATAICSLEGNLIQITLEQFKLLYPMLSGNRNLSQI